MSRNVTRDTLHYLSFSVAGKPLVADWHRERRKVKSRQKENKWLHNFDEEKLPGGAFLRTADSPLLRIKVRYKSCILCFTKIAGLHTVSAGVIRARRSPLFINLATAHSVHTYKEIRSFSRLLERTNGKSGKLLSTRDTFISYRAARTREKYEQTRASRLYIDTA